MAVFNMIEEADATGKIKEVFEDIGKKKGRSIPRKLWPKSGFKLMVKPQISKEIDDGSHMNMYRLQSIQNLSDGHAKRQVLFYKNK